MAKKESSEIIIKPLRLETVFVPIEGETELITHRWSEKARRMMLEKQMKKAASPKEAKDPEEDYESSIYRFEDGSIGFPAGAFKASIIRVCRKEDGLPMTLAKISIRVNGENGKDGVPLVKITGEPRMREDMVRLETGVADIRFRAGFPKWSANLSVTYNAGILSLEQVINLINAAGMLSGVGEWRPSSPKTASGSNGCFHVVTKGAKS